MALSPSRFIAALGLSVTLASPLLAETPAQGVAEKMLLSQVIAGLEEQGFRIKEVDVGRDRIDVEAYGPDGREVDLEVSPVDGSILATHHEI